jgi:hypothetical protein
MKPGDFTVDCTGKSADPLCEKNDFGPHWEGNSLASKPG